MSILGTAAGLPADSTLLVQIAGFIVLFLGAVYAKRKNFLEHFKLTKITVFLGVIAFVWMGFSLMKNFQSILSNFATLQSELTVLHVIVGAPALLAGISFSFNRLIKKTRYPMRTTFLLWTAALFLGIAVYITYYVRLS